MTRNFNAALLVLAMVCLLAVPALAQTTNYGVGTPSQPDATGTLPTVTFTWMHMSAHPFVGTDPFSLSMAKLWNPSVFVFLETKDPNVRTFAVVLVYRDEAGRDVTVTDSKFRDANGKATSIFSVPKRAVVRDIQVEGTAGYGTGSRYVAP